MRAAADLFRALPLVALLLTLTAAPLSAMGWLGQRTAEPPPPAAPRPVVSMLVEDLPSARRSFAGVVVAGTEVQIGFQTLGRLSSRPVDIGDHVETGDLLAELAPDDLQDNVRAARSAVASARVTLETAEATAERTRDLARRNVATKAQLEQAERGLKSAEAGLQQALSEKARAEDAEGFARLLAPFDGVVSAVFESPGAVVNAGTPIVTLSDVETREAVIDLPEAVLSSTPVGTPAEMWLESDPSIRSSGRVTRIEALADTATRTRRVHIAMDSPQNFRLGALIRAQRGDLPNTVLTLPRDAITGPAEAPMVWVVTREPDGTATVHARDVTLREATDDSSVVVAEGLDPGEEVVIRGVNSLNDGQQVGERVAP